MDGCDEKRSSEAAAHQLNKRRCSIKFLHDEPVKRSWSSLHFIHLLFTLQFGFTCLSCKAAALKMMFLSEELRAELAVS